MDKDINAPGYGQPAEVRVVFVERDNAPERLACEAELHFGSGPLAGLKMVGFSLWSSPGGEVYVTFPSRAFGPGSERRFFDFLRSIEGGMEDTKRVKRWIIEAFETAKAAGFPGGAESR